MSHIQRQFISEDQMVEIKKRGWQSKVRACLWDSKECECPNSESECRILHDLKKWLKHSSHKLNIQFNFTKAQNFSLPFILQEKIYTYLLLSWIRFNIWQFFSKAPNWTKITNRSMVFHCYLDTTCSKAIIILSTLQLVLRPCSKR